MLIATCRAKSWTANLTRHSHNRAFTLLELVVVLALLAIVTTAVTMSLRQPLQNARLQRALASLEDADHRARVEARKWSTAVELRITSTGEVRQTALHAADAALSERVVALDGGLRIDRFLTASADSDEGELVVRISPTGQSDTYAIRLRAGDQRQAWLLVVGASGQTNRTNEDNTVETLVSMQR